METEPTAVPTPELLLDVRTPAELTLSPDGAKLAFALHATVADQGSFVPSDLYLMGTEPGTRTEQLTSGGWSDRTPVWSPDGARLAFLSDRITPGHQLPYTMPTAGGAPTEGIADPDRLGISGLSYGGYMAGWAVGQTDRFAAAVAMSVVADYVSFHLTSEVWWYDQATLEGEWHDPASQYADRSPVTHAHRCTTPTLILQGAEDRCTPLSQAEELFNAIATTGTDVELVVYPREGHVPLERAHALDAIRRTQAWFDRHLR